MGDISNLDFFFFYSNPGINNYFGYYYDKYDVIKIVVPKEIIQNSSEAFIKVEYRHDLDISYYYNLDKCNLFIDNYNNILLDKLISGNYIIFNLVLNEGSVLPGKIILNKRLEENLKLIEKL